MPVTVTDAVCPSGTTAGLSVTCGPPTAMTAVAMTVAITSTQ
jgi:hypothetical protein